MTMTTDTRNALMNETVLPNVTVFDLLMVSVDSIENTRRALGEGWPNAAYGMVTRATAVLSALPESAERTYWLDAASQLAAQATAAADGVPINPWARTSNDPIAVSGPDEGDQFSIY